MRADDRSPMADGRWPMADDLIDLLVEGELDPARRRALLTRLDDEPDGWRRLALAFLEAQCWRESFGALVREGTPTVAGTRPFPRRPVPGLVRRAALAAGLL